jgi:hypothetical protein
MASPYADYYAQNLEQSTVPVSTGQQFIQEDVDRKQAVDKEIGTAAEKYANEKGIGIADARALMQARYNNMISSEKAKVAMETRDLNAQSALSQAQIELSQINPSAENAVDLYSDVAKKHAPNLVGTKHFNDFSSQLKTQQNEALKFRQEARKQELEQEALKQGTPEYKADVAQKVAQATEETKLNIIKARTEEAAKDPKTALKEINMGLQSVMMERNALTKDLPVAEGKLSSPAYFLDEKGKKTMDSSKAKQAVWLDAKKNKFTLAEDERQDALSRLQDIKKSEKYYVDTRKALYSKTPSDQVAPTAVQPSAQQPSSVSKTQPTPVEAPAMESEGVKPSGVETLEQQTERIYPGRATQEQKKSLSKSLGSATKQYLSLEDELKKISSMGEDKYKELYGVDPESVKQKFDKAKSVKSFYEARDEGRIKFNLENLQGDELIDFKENYLAPALMEEAGGDPQKARDLAAQKGYQF